MSTVWHSGEVRAVPCPCSMFGSPTGQGEYSEGSSLEVGFKFVPAANGYVTSVRFYKQGSMGGTHNGTLWTTGGSQLSTITFTGETSSGWQEMSFSSPVAVTAGTTYVASVTMQDGNYLATSHYFTSDVINGPLKAPSSSSSGGNGIFGSGGSFPTSSFNETNYWVDISYYDPSAPTIDTIAPSSGATDVRPGDTIKAVFNEEMDTSTINSDTFFVKDSNGDNVTGTITYSDTTKTATFLTPDGLNTSTTYTVTVKGGTGTVVKNKAGIALGEDRVWSFTTSSQNLSPSSLKNKATPKGAGTYIDSGSLELGVKIKPSTNGYITAIRFYKPIISPDTTTTGHIWSSTGSSLATASFSNQTGYGWQEAKLSTPLRVYQDQLYVVSYTATSAVYTATNAALTGADITGGYLTAYASGSAQNAATGSGNSNGVFTTTAGAYPGSGSGSGSYYWVDAVFSISSTVSDPLSVVVTQPTSGAFGIKRSQSITAKFNHVLDSSTVNSSSFRLFDASGNQVAGSVSYDDTAGQAVFDPSGSLSYGQKYTARISTLVADVNGQTLASEHSWSFTVGSQLSSDPALGTGGPILVITSSGNNYSQYYAEILHAEGLNGFDSKDIGDVNVGVLGNYKAVILSEMSLTQDQANLFSNWVNSGGNLIAMRPDSKLAGLLGLTAAGSTRTNQYMLIDTSQSPGSGLVSETIQFKGVADNYSANGATTVATYYSDASTSTSNPAVTTRQVGSDGGTAVAFTYDLAKSVIAMHQGNKAWVGQERDGSAPVRLDDMFYGAKTGDIQPDWVDLNKIQIPQADEQQRLLANIITESTKDKQPMPRFWYLPDGYKAAMVMAGDDHALSGSVGTLMTMNNWLNDSDADCSLMDWECVRASHYIYKSTDLTNARALQYHNLGFEIGAHPGTGCVNYSSYATLLTEYTTTIDDWHTKYTSIPDQVSSRYHCYAWSDWDSQPKVESALNIGYDLNGVVYPASWIGTRGTLMTGSGMNMRLTDTAGNTLNVRQGVTNFDDQTVTATNINTVLGNATGSAGYYGIFGTHYDMTNTFDKTLYNAAVTYDVPMITSQQALTWLSGRESSTFANFTGSGGRYSFTVAAAEGATGMKAMMPIQDAGGTLTSLVLSSSTVSYQTQTVKGVQYAVFDAAPGSYTATYSDYSPNSGGGSSGDTPTANTVITPKKSYSVTPTEEPGAETTTTEEAPNKQKGKPGQNEEKTKSGLPAWAWWLIGAGVSAATFFVVLAVRRRKTNTVS